MITITKLHRKRIALLTTIFIFVAIAVFAILKTLEQNINLFFTPSQIFSENINTSSNIRVGGFVEQNSLTRDENLNNNFTVTDGLYNIKVSYQGILPDLFKEGQGVVVLGKLTEKKDFIATEVLAKHDENYMPPEVADELKKQGTFEHFKQGKNDN